MKNKKWMTYVMTILLVGTTCLKSVPSFAASEITTKTVVTQDKKNISAAPIEKNKEQSLSEVTTDKGETQDISKVSELDKDPNALRGEESTTVEMSVEEEKESNDTLENANLIELGTQVKGKIGNHINPADREKDRIDYYKIVLSEDGKVMLSLNADQDLSLIMKLMNEDGTKAIQTINGANKELFISNKLEAGTYYIRISYTTGKEGNYTLKTNFSKPQILGDSKENDSFEQAQKYTLGNKITGHLGYTNAQGLIDKEDWYKFTLTKETEVNFNLMTTSQLGAFIKLYDKEKLLKTTSSMGNKVGMSAKLPKGTYYIGIKRTTGAGEYSVIGNIQANDIKK